MLTKMLSVHDEVAKLFEFSRRDDGCSLVEVDGSKLFMGYAEVYNLIGTEQSSRTCLTMLRLLS